MRFSSVVEGFISVLTLGSPVSFRSQGSYIRVRLGSDFVVETSNGHTIREVSGRLEPPSRCLGESTL